MYRQWQRIILLFAVGVVLSGWCSLVSGFGGWLIGYNLGRHDSVAALLPETGVLVTRVEHNSPAEHAGICRGHMIVAINGVRVHDVPALRGELQSYHPGDKVLLTYRYDLGEQATHVLLGNFPGADDPYLGIYFTARAEEPADI